MLALKASTCFCDIYHAMLGVVINFCSNEKAFLGALLDQVRLFTNHIVVCYGTHTYDGAKEDVAAFIKFQAYRHEGVRFVEFPVDMSMDPSQMRGVVKRPTAYWCNLARWLGIQALPEAVDWVLFLDADEVPEGERVRDWMARVSLKEGHIYKLANYWYFKDVRNQAAVHEDSILLAPRSILNEGSVFHDDERDGIIKVSGAPQERMVMGTDGRPMFHHYSWVRTKDGLAKKLRTWAHRDDIFKGADVDAIVGYIYKNEEVNDIVHNYPYNRVENLFGITI